MGKGLLHGLRRTDELGQEVLPALIARAHFGDGRDQDVLHQGERLGTGGQLFFQQGQHILQVPEKDGIPQRLGSGARPLPCPDHTAAGFPVGIGGDERTGVAVAPLQHGHGITGLMQAWRGRIGDAGREPGARAHGHEGGIEQVAGRQAERNIGKPQRGRQPLAAAPADHLKALQGALGLGGHGKGQDVHHHQTAGDAQGIGLFQQLFHDGDALGGPDGQFRPLQGEQDEGRAEIAADRPQQLHPPGFAADGIDKEGARTVGQGTGDGLGAGRIQRQGHVHPGDQTLH